MASERTIFVGQAPGRGRGEEPIGGRCGRRLAALLGVPALRPGFATTNLLVEFPGKAGKGDRFPLADARAAAERFELADPHGRVVLLGRNVCSAFELSLAPLERSEERSRCWLHVPHPSGVNLWWNDTGNVVAARRALRDFVA